LPAKMAVRRGLPEDRLPEPEPLYYRGGPEIKRLINLACNKTAAPVSTKLDLCIIILFFAGLAIKARPAKKIVNKSDQTVQGPFSLCPLLRKLAYFSSHQPHRPPPKNLAPEITLTDILEYRSKGPSTVLSATKTKQLKNDLPTNRPVLKSTNTISHPICIPIYWNIGLNIRKRLCTAAHQIK